MRPMPLLAAGLLTATLLTTTAPAYAAGETCQGQPATIVGTQYQFGLTGTEGPDVVVTNGATSVSTLGGDDLVCVTGTGGSTQMTLDTGAGDDVVDGTASPNGVSVQLGTGRDRFTGSAHFDAVNTGPAGETDQDVVQMGSSPLAGVSAGSYGNTAPNPDVVVLGPNGGSASWHGPMAPGARLDGGGGPSELYLYPGGGDVTVDATAGTLVEDGTTLVSWTGFQDYSLSRRDAQAPASLTFTGTDRDEEVWLDIEDAYDGRQRIDMGGGDDTLFIGSYGSRIGGSRSTYDGGAGDDHVAFFAGNRLDLDLASGRLVSTQGGRTLKTTVKDFERPLVSAKKIAITGTKGSDEIRFYGCTVTIHGRAGKDDIAQDRGNDYFESGLCRTRVFRIHGDGGNDTIRGSLGNDVLIGGPGRDTIHGNGGRDRCSGEKLTSCEIKLR